MSGNTYHGSAYGPRAEPTNERKAATLNAAARARNAETRRINKNTLEKSLNNFKQNAINGPTWKHYLKMYVSERKGTFGNSALGFSEGEQGATNLQKGVLKSVKEIHTAIVNLPAKISLKGLLTEMPVRAHIGGKNNPVCLAASNGMIDSFKYLYGVILFNNLEINDSACLGEQQEKFNSMNNNYLGEIKAFVANLKSKPVTRKVGPKLRGGARTRKSKNMLSSAKRWMKQMSRVFTKKTRKHRQ